MSRRNGVAEPARAEDALLNLPVGAYGDGPGERPYLVGVARSRVRLQRRLPSDAPVVLVAGAPAVVPDLEDAEWV